MRISIILLALAMLIAYTIPAMSDDCAQQGGQSCGKADTACDGQCGNCSCDGECAEGCECGRSGECGESCGESCAEGDSCGDSQGCEEGSCSDGAECGDCQKYEARDAGYWHGDFRWRRMGMRQGDRKSYYFAEKRDFQRLVDKELKLCPYQKLMLMEERDAYLSQVENIEQLYFADRSISIEDLNHRLTLLNRNYDRCTRRMLNPLQDTVFPEHMWMLYSSPIWNKGFHPGSKHVLRDLLDEYERDFRRSYGERGRWADEREE